MPNLSSLPEFGEFYAEYYDPVAKSFEIRRKSRTDGNISLSETMELIDAYLSKYQMVFVPNKVDKSLILFPFMFIQPQEGDKIINTTTKEVYTVDQIIINPTSGLWEGLLRLNLINPPSVESLHSLEYQSLNRAVRFDHEVPNSIPNPLGANLEKLLKQPPPMHPTITWTIKSVEPGSLGTINSSKKEWKPRLRETFKDPLVMGHTIEVLGQFFDNIVQFDCWSNDPRTSDRLVRWFEQFMRLYAGSLRRAGLSNLFFWKRPEEESNQTWRQAYSVKGTQYFIRTEQLEASYSRDILNIDISVSIESSTPRNRKYNETRWIADQIVSGNLSYDEYRSLFYHSGNYLFGSIDIRQ